MTTIIGPTAGDPKLWEDLKFCPSCNYAKPKIAIKHAAVDFDCPSCGRSTLSQFYSFGSDTHLKQLERFARAEATGFKSIDSKLLNVLKLPPPQPKQEDDHD